ncbi:MAG: hypothetical protein JWP26_1932 [Devosia sp.]|uniref:hypothetical protein n=1 Tax=Devosia sp. TaxID=1871048 RepID=UPI0026318EC3|nr:hypothetical protein [Devosia sp.]MDB5536136.1 hypothetical protein [Devosia sp.]MDB5586962.1 hypothetical protein [Devosia sp.]
MMTYAKLPLAGLLLVALAMPAWAQDASQPPLAEADGALTLDRLGHHLTMPMPDWLKEPSGPIESQIEIRYVGDDRQAVVELRPKGETEALWNTLYGARITLGATRPLAQFRAAVMAGYAATCKPESTGFFQLQPDQGEVLAPLGFICGGYRDDLTGYRGLGEVAVMSFKKSTTGVAIVFQEWRGKSFDPKTPSTWPVATDVVQARATQLQDQAALTPTD